MPLPNILRRRSRSAITPTPQRRITRADVAQWRGSMDLLVACRIGRELFHQYLKQHSAEENLAFWMKINEFKKLEGFSQERLRSEAQQIWDNYFGPCDDDQIILTSGALRKEIEARLSNPTLQMFDEQLRFIKNLLRMERFLDFFRSDVFKNFEKTLRQ